ncbi:MAG: hypothetical protein GC190_10920 [Alphaproteobacteria bacterium]|nr:hypothetical protein [Alphaproteobacteria bacterium]
MHQVVIGNWALEIQVGDRPPHFDWLEERSLLVDEVDLASGGGGQLFVAVYSLDRRPPGEHNPIITLAQRYEPHDFGFYPGFLIAPETERLFVGAGDRLVAYDLNAPARLWLDKADCGFWRWGRIRDLVWMEAELEFAVWSIVGEKRWTTFVEPPWAARIVDDTVELDVMGVKQVRRLSNGEAIG